MQPNAIIESYVGDIVRHLPRRQRSDVGFELRSLLTEDLEGRAQERGRPADEAMTVEMLTAFGRPQEVADRYRPAGFTVTPPAEAPRFAKLALGGVALQWAVTLPAALLGPVQTQDWAYAATWWGRLTTWWWSWGLGSFWWPGFLITLTLISALISHRRGEPKPWTPRPAVDRDSVNRATTVLGLTLGVIGATVVIALPWLAYWLPNLPQPILDAFAFDPEFLQWRAPWVLLLWAADFGLYLAVLVAGRWNRVTRRVALGINVAWLGLLTWWLLAGDIFQAEAADSTAKGSLILILVIVIIDTAVTIRRTTTPFRPPVL